MADEYLTVEHLTKKDIKRIFRKICVHPDVVWDGSPCWLWCATRGRQGHGRTSLGYQLMFAHRLLYAWLVGPVPFNSRTQHLDHLCRRPSCCNPAHLELVTARVNVLRGAGFAAKNAHKTHCPAGHEYAGDNLYRLPKGGRACKTCAREAGRRFDRAHQKERSAKHAEWQRRNREHLKAYEQKRQLALKAKSLPKGS